ncbi:hypothetical protein JXA12_04130 [Candidatus Woesearchaeota archaeon]|nr:hypothetical protein [Candidatus Woesearchaeota archaeon]
MDGSRLRVVERGIRKGFAKIKGELDDHLDGINRNATEMQSLFDYLVELEGKLDKLHERLDSVELAVREPAGRGVVAPLSYREQEVFLVLYTSELPVSASAVAARLGLSEEVVRHVVACLVSKGVPLLRQVRGGEVMFSLELRFKDAQARGNLVRIDERVSALWAQNSS